MALVEADEGELQVARSARALLDKLGSNDKTRGALLGLIKEVNPDAVIPEVEAKRAAKAEVAGVQEELAALKKAMADKEAAEAQAKLESKAERMVREGRSKLRDAGYTDDGIASVEKLMETEGLANYDHALAVYERKHPAKEEMVSPMDYSKSWDIATPTTADDDHKLLLDNPDAFAKKKVNEVLNEFRAPNWRNR